MLAVAADPDIAAVEAALSSAGAARVIVARLPATGEETILV